MFALKLRGKQDVFQIIEKLDRIFLKIQIRGFFFDFLFQVCVQTREVLDHEVHAVGEIADLIVFTVRASAGEVPGAYGGGKIGELFKRIKKDSS